MTTCLCLCLCVFVTNQSHVFSQPQVWSRWLADGNTTRIHIYIHAKYPQQLRIPPDLQPWCTVLPTSIPTSYLYMVPAYEYAMHYILHASKNNAWIGFVTETCCPARRLQSIIHELDSAPMHASWLRWKPAWWPVAFHHRANLRRLPPELHLGHDPWFVLSRRDAQEVITLTPEQQRVRNVVVQGPIANESWVAILLHMKGRLSHVHNSVTHAANWTPMSSSTSPHVFGTTEQDHRLLLQTLSACPTAWFVRKVHSNRVHNYWLHVVAAR